MTPDEIKELKELIEFLKENDIGEFDLDRGDLKVRIKFGHPSQGTSASAVDIARLGQLLASGQHAPVATSQGIHAVASASPATAADALAEEEQALHIVKSPIVGTFYESSSPGAAAFGRRHVTVGLAMAVPGDHPHVSSAARHHVAIHFD